MIRDYYQILGVDKNSDALAIKRAYRKLALLYHPDVNKNINANDQFIRITEAYEILIDQSKRSDYNILYDKFFGGKISIIVEDLYASTKSKEWNKYGSMKAEEYSNLNINEFMKYVFGEAFYHGKQVSKIGCSAYLWIGTGLMGLIGMAIAIVDMDIADEELGFVIFMGVIFVIITITGIRHTKKQIIEYKQDYKARRKNRSQ